VCCALSERKIIGFVFLDEQFLNISSSQFYTVTHVTNRRREMYDKPFSLKEFREIFSTKIKTDLVLVLNRAVRIFESC
jgi:hypothetical protein